MEAGDFSVRINQMVQQFTVEGIGGGREPPRCAAIRMAGPFVAARMVVGHQDRGAAMGGNVDDDRAQREGCARIIAAVPAQVYAPGLVVEVRDPQVFA